MEDGQRLHGRLHGRLQPCNASAAVQMAGCRAWRMALCCAVIAFLGCRSAGAVTVIPVTGLISAMNDHKGDERFYITDSNGRAFQLPVVLPVVLSTNQPPKPGAWVQLSCTVLDDNPRTCSTVSNLKELPAPGNLGPTFSAAGATDIHVKLLIMIVSFTGSCIRKAAYSASQVHNMYFWQDGYADFIEQCSYGTFTISETGSAVLETTVQCNRWMNDECDFLGIAEAADSQATLALGSEAFKAFTHYTYIMPEGMMYTACSWAGLAARPGRRTWLQTSKTEDAGLEKMGVVMQELLHNFGLAHSYRDGREYQDASSSMGKGDVCPSAYEIGRLGWASPLATISSEDIPAGSLRRYVLPATYLGSSGAFLRVKPDWMGSKWISNLYLALRARGGGDAALDDGFNQKISIHAVDRFVDDNDEDLTDPQSDLRVVMDSRSEQDFSRYQLLVRTGALLEKGTKMEVTLCRYKNAPKECSGSAAPGPTQKQSPPPPPPKTARVNSPPPPPPAQSGGKVPAPAPAPAPIPAATAASPNIIDVAPSSANAAIAYSPQDAPLWDIPGPGYRARLVYSNIDLAGHGTPHYGSCRPNATHDWNGWPAVYARFRLGTSGVVRVNTNICSWDGDKALLLYADPFPGGGAAGNQGRCVAWSDDVPGIGTCGLVDFPAEAGVTYWVVVVGKASAGTLIKMIPIDMAYAANGVNVVGPSPSAARATPAIAYTPQDAPLWELPGPGYRSSVEWRNVDLAGRGTLNQGRSNIKCPWISKSIYARFKVQAFGYVVVTTAGCDDLNGIGSSESRGSKWLGTVTLSVYENPYPFLDVAHANAQGCAQGGDTLYPTWSRCATLVLAPKTDTVYWVVVSSESATLPRVPLDIAYVLVGS